MDCSDLRLVLADSNRRARGGSRRVLLFTLFALVAACGPNEQTKRAIAATANYVERLEALEAARADAPVEASGFELPVGVTLRVRCGIPLECVASNTAFVAESSLERHRTLLDALRHGRRPPNLDWFLETELPLLPNLRFLAVKIPNHGGVTAWDGRVALWDSERRNWMGAVRVDLERGSVPARRYARFDGNGNQISPGFYDRDEDRRTANRNFAETLRRAFIHAVESGEHVMDVEQVPNDSR